MRRREAGGGADLRAMQAAVQRSWSPRQRWHAGDLAWQCHAGFAGPAAIWTEGATPIAWAMVEPSGEAGLHVDPDRPGAADPVLAWLRAHAPGGRPAVTVLDTETHLTDALHRNGFGPVDDAPYFLHCERALDSLPDRPRLPAGFTTRAVRPGEIPARAAAHRAAWRPARVGALLVPPVALAGESEMSAQRYRSVTTTWPYRPELDQVVVAPGGGFAAFALGWLDGANAAGELEPVGTDPRYARRGLAAAASIACLHALRAAGATRAVVYPRGDAAYPVPRRLYTALGFRPVARTVTYRPRP
ncbi:N-acetyltransferase [Actinocatenispora thailandica]|uniref:N-acetyltransferase n=1 Tax=Actinocatenispora thailandica TaxID=227318 RepID=A0A7R7HXG5_9ACTN|nr:GNAT family N-acetyltransferase [Actinocatenispora thailandica]BCJ35721.1 N-acetyltransferase [Actinocatenispora thailandica]